MKFISTTKPSETFRALFAPPECYNKTYKKQFKITQQVVLVSVHTIKETGGVVDCSKGNLCPNTQTTGHCSTLRGTKHRGSNFKVAFLV